MNFKFVLHLFFMALPFFYKEDIPATAKTVTLDEATSKHIVQVLRMKIGEQLNLTDGKGNIFLTEITDDNRKKCEVIILNKSEIQNPKSKIVIAISIVKNNSRFEWFLEKATEIGVTEIIPLVCERTEKAAFKFERMNGILISAMLQSQQAALPVLHDPVKYTDLVKDNNTARRFIAHCVEDKDRQPLNQHISRSADQLIVIGPEGDFTKAEIELALQNDFIPVSLGDTRLRTETAGIVAATLMCLV